MRRHLMAVVVSAALALTAASAIPGGPGELIKATSKARPGALASSALTGFEGPLPLGQDAKAAIANDWSQLLPDVDNPFPPVPWGRAPGGTGSAAAGPAASERQINWTSCGKAVAAECGALLVPLDYQRPSGPKLSIALVRLRATDPGRRVGSLLFNPGGPGVAGTQWILQPGGRQAFSRQLRARFDIVTFDPRGTGASGAIDCLTNAQLDAYYASNRIPETSADAERYFRRDLDYNAACGKRYGSRLQHLSTPDTARDVDRIRAALGDARLNWLGVSYGTALGASYAELFPRQVRTMVLDAGLDHSIDLSTLATERAVAMEQSFDRFAGWCDRTQECAVGTGARATFDALVARARTAPLAVPKAPGRPGVNNTDIVSTASALLTFGKAAWPTIASAMASANAGDASAFRLLQDSFLERTEKGYQPGSAAFRAILCLSWPSQARTPQEAARLAARAAKLAPRFGATTAWEFATLCARWPAKVADPPHRLQAAQAPIVVVGASFDPSTPYIWSSRMAQQLPGAVLVTRMGDGHWSYNKSTCAARLEDRYLIEDTVPAKGSACKSDLDFPRLGAE